MAPYQESWKRLNPDWDYRLWTDADNEALVRDEFPSLLDLYLSLPRAIHRADFARLLYLRRFGGLYVDLDIQALEPLDARLDGYRCVLGREPKLHAQQLRGVESVVCNAAMASEPGHPFWDEMIHEIKERSTQGPKDPVWMTGPLCLQAAYEAHGARLGVKLWDPDVFFPLPDLGNRQLRLSQAERHYFARMHSSGCYPRCSLGVHHWAHTWIPMHSVRRTAREALGVVRGVRSVLRGQVTADELLRPHRYGVTFPEQRFVPRPSRQAEYAEVRDAGRHAASRSNIAVAVLIHDRIDLVRILRARLELFAELFRDARVYIMGEDSTDGTEEVLREWSRDSPGLLRLVPPVTTSARGVARIAALRNALLDALERDTATDFVSVLDGDLEGPISLDGIAHTVGMLHEDDEMSAVAAFGINNWIGLDAPVPFLGYSYYDPLAFREQRWERSQSDAAIRWRLRGLRRGDPAVMTKSAFAGCAIYRSPTIRGLRYPLDGNDCEHVGFHRGLARRGGRMCVNPAMLLLAGKQGHHESWGDSELLGKP